MATRKNQRKNLLIAVVLALLAAGALCVWGAAALGFEVTSPILEAVFDGDPNTTVTLGGEAGADAELSSTGGGATADTGTQADVDTGTGDQDGAGDEAGDGSGSGNGSGGAADGNASTGSGFCILNLVCFDQVADVAVSADTGANANTSGAADTNALLDVDADANNDGLGIAADANVDAETATVGQCQLLDLNALLNSGVQADADVAAVCDSILLNADAQTDN